MKLKSNYKIALVLLLSFGFFTSRALAKCTVEKFSLEKQVFQVLRNGKRISQPDLACNGSPVFSPSGKYIAFTECERNYDRLGDDLRIYELVIFNCETGKNAGYLAVPLDKREAMLVHQWASDESAVNLVKRTEPVGLEQITFRFTGAEVLP